MKAVKVHQCGVSILTPNVFKGKRPIQVLVERMIQNSLFKQKAESVEEKY